MQVELQVPALHDRVATLVDAHARAHAPQLSTLTSVLISHPSSATAASGCPQFAYGALHDELHVPPLHDSAATFAFEQARPQAPQLPVFVLRFVSQPSSTAPALGCAQFAYGAMHDESQTPALHESVATFVEAHARPQPPQLTVLVARLVSHPSSAPPASGIEQLPNVPLHVELQSPPLHESDATLLLEQARPHAPQLSVFDARFVSHPSSAPPASGIEQFPNGGLQAELQRPPLHDAVATLVIEQARPQAPQFPALVLTLTSHPSSGFGEAGAAQLAKGATHVELHVPPLHESVSTPASEQLRPQAPQLAAFELRFVSQPSSAPFGLGCVQFPYGVWHVE
ncbi:MAG: hypothetical protein HYY84_08870 [Deltaproteobacteria bacterium]|nr:hypothetical protein [Deltaproteobacteria bacterium]